MRCLLYLAAFIVLAVSSAALAAAEPAPAKTDAKLPNIPGAFHAYNVTGKYKGHYHSHISEYGLEPIVMIVTREAEFSDPLKSLLKKIDDAIAKNPAARLHAFVVVLSDDVPEVVGADNKSDDKRIEVTTQLEDQAKALMLMHIDIVLASKIGRVRMGPQRKLVRDSTPAEIKAGIEASLKRLGTDWIDHFQIHWSDPDTAFEDTFGAMEELVKSGKIRSVGICNFMGDEVRRAYAAYPQLATLQSPYSMLRRNLETNTFHFCAHRGIGILPYWPLEQGVLTGRYTSANPPANASSQVMDQIRTVDRLRPLAEEIGQPISHIALSWLLSRPGVAAVIPGASKVEQLEENCRIASFTLSADEVYEIDRLLAATSVA